MPAEKKLPVTVGAITVGAITITSCVYSPFKGYEALEGPDSFPEFLVTGRVRLPDGEHDFTRKVILSLKSPNAGHGHVSGPDFEDLPRNGEPHGLSQVADDLYKAVGQTEAWHERAKAYAAR